MFRRGERELVTQWRPATWDNILGYAVNLKDGKDHDWNFSVTLLEGADPETLVLGYSYGDNSQSVFTLSVRVTGALAWRLVQLNQYSKGDNYLQNFSVHQTIEDLEKLVGADNIDRSTTLPKLEL